MPEYTITNMAEFAGDYGDDDTLTFYSNEVTTTIVRGIEAIKTADQEFWVNGPLTYTIVITNTSGKPLTNIIFRDQLDGNLVTLDTEAEVTLNDVPVTYTFYSDILSFTIPEIDVGTAATVVFSVAQV